MKGLKIDFSGDTPVLKLDSVVEGFDTTVQAVLIGLGTSLGSDPIYPDRGTDLMRSALLGRLFSKNRASHECNFAAARVKDFLEGVTPKSETERIQRIRIVPTLFTRQRLETNVMIETTEGRTVGTEFII